MKKLACSILGGILLPLHISFAQEFTVDTLAQSPAISSPASMAFVPGEKVRFFFTEKNTGRIRIFEDEAVRPAPFATLAVVSAGEQGLRGIALHPQYPDSPFVYAQYTRSGDRANVVVRLRDSIGYGIDPRLILVAPRINIATNNNGGGLQFGPDGMLYCSIGENGIRAYAQDSSGGSVLGKILRLNPNGRIPLDNPFAGKPFWSVGHRNSVDFTFDALTGIMYCTESGPSCSDEVNVVPPRANLGWPIEGNCSYTDNAEYVRPLYIFAGPPLPGLRGIAVYRRDAFPRLRGNLLFTGMNSPGVWMLTLTPSGDTVVAESFSTLLTYSKGIADVAIGPDGNIYLTSGAGDESRLLRLSPVVPKFTSAPPRNAIQDSLYMYTPRFDGTTPVISIVAGPAGMEVDSSTWSIAWTPTNEQALQEAHHVVLRAENGAGSVEQSFSVRVKNVNDPPGEFSLTSPPNDTTFVFNNDVPHIFFTWTQSFDPDLDTVYYVIEFDTVSTFNSPAYRDTAAGIHLTLPVELPRKSRDYFWRVRSSDGHHSTIGSQVRRFRVTYVTGAEERSSKLSEEEEPAILEQNFPNPFNPTTNIVYTIPKGGYVRLAVFNLLGQEVARIFEGVQSAGTYEVTFNKEELPTGIYFYRIQAPGFAETRKMIITK